VLEKDSYLPLPFWILKEAALTELKDHMMRFYNSLSGVSFNSLSVDLITKKLKEFNLDEDILMKHYLRRVEERNL
jgi:hypothetical protein